MCWDVSMKSWMICKEEKQAITMAGTSAEANLSVSELNKGSRQRTCFRKWNKSWHDVFFQCSSGLWQGALHVCSGHLFGICQRHFQNQGLKTCGPSNRFCTVLLPNLILNILQVFTEYHWREWFAAGRTWWDSGYGGSDDWGWGAATGTASPALLVCLGYRRYPT